MRPIVRGRAWWRLALLLFCFAGVVAAEESIASPAAVLGFDPAADGAVLNSARVARCLAQWAEVSPQLRVEILGLSTAGRPLLGAVISSPENLARLEAIRTQRDRTVVLVTVAVHPLELAATPAGLRLIHRLLSGQTPRAREILQSLIVLVVPCMNPDGADRIATWLEAGGGGDKDSRLPFLQHCYAGHDLNRDWLLGTQAETRAIIERIHTRWRPWLTVDIHQMDSHGPRLFVPPYVEPVDPDIAVDLLEHTDRLGARVLDRLTQSGRHGVARRWSYDAWTPSRAFPFYHGGMRFLLEAASGDRQRPLLLEAEQVRVFAGTNAPTLDHPAPWQGGRWGLPEAVDYLSAAAELAIDAMLDEPWKSGANRHAAGLGPATRIRLAGGRDGTRARNELLGALELGGAELWQAGDGESWIVADPAWGRGWCRTLLLPKLYPESVLARVGLPYDASAHNLAALAGHQAELVTGAAPAQFRRAPAPRLPLPVSSRGSHAPLRLLDVGVSQDAGWLRWTLADRGFEFEVCDSAMLAEARLAPGSVVIVPEAEDGLSRPIIELLAAAANSGHRVLVVGLSARHFARSQNLPLVEALGTGNRIAGAVLQTRWASEPGRDFLARGLTAPPSILQGRGPIWAMPVAAPAQPILLLADEPLHSGLLTPAQRQAVRGAAVVVRIPTGRAGGEWILFSFSPCYRGWTLAAEEILWNAVAAR